MWGASDNRAVNICPPLVYINILVNTHKVLASSMQSIHIRTIPSLAATIPIDDMKGFSVLWVNKVSAYNAQMHVAWMYINELPNHCCYTYTSSIRCSFVQLNIAIGTTNLRTHLSFNLILIPRFMFMYDCAVFTWMYADCYQDHPVAEIKDDIEAAAHS